MNAVLEAHADWSVLHSELDAQGWSVFQSMLSAQVCQEITGLFDRDEHFRSRVVMSRHGFGRGEYKYFRYPLPPMVQQLREQIYPKLVPLANAWNDRLKTKLQFPQHHAAFLDRCHAAQQTLPTPLLLKYGPGDYNCLHQDLYGEHVFSLQVAVLLSQPGRDFTGGEFVLTQQRPRMQTRVSVPPIRQGDALVFAVRQRPVHASKGESRVNQRHGVSQVLTGKRYTLGIIFHDAKT